MYVGWALQMLFTYVIGTTRGFSKISKNKKFRINKKKNIELTFVFNFVFVKGWIEKLSAIKTSISGTVH